MSYDDDRPGMMRVHIADRRAQAMVDAFTRDALRHHCRVRELPTGGRKHDLARRLANAGMVAPGYDKAAER